MRRAFVAVSISPRRPVRARPSCPPPYRRPSRAAGRLLRGPHGAALSGGVMNLFWIAAITLFVLLEKVVRRGDQGGRVAGVAMIPIGLFMVAGFE